jgi:hypothetical protein
MAEVAALTAVVQFLNYYSYRPLNLEEALVIAQACEPHIKTHNLRAQLEEHPEIRLFVHGDLQIGHVTWRWFDPQRARASRRVEWALRLIHSPASPTEIAQVIRDRLGVMDVSAFSVADACERDPDGFFEQDGAYGLAIWQETHSLRQPLLELLADGSLQVTEFADRWAKRFTLPFSPELVLAALHIGRDNFYTVGPLRWTCTDTKKISAYDLHSFSFEDLMPTL